MIMPLGGWWVVREIALPEKVLPNQSIFCCMIRVFGGSDMQ
tara:strand:- start:223 stop:345 length:123 start_codon:yes stop_codon:yes gene_type:complete